MGALHNPPLNMSSDPSLAHLHKTHHPSHPVIRIMAMVGSDPRIVRDPIRRDVLHWIDQDGILERATLGSILQLKEMAMQMHRMRHHAHVLILEANQT
jgi:hypothetical protein